MSKNIDVFIFYLCIGNIDENKILIDFISQKKKSDKKDFKNIAKKTINQFNLVRLNYGERYNYSYKDYQVVAVSEKSLKYLFVCIMSLDYPQYKIFSLLDELISKVQKYINGDKLIENKDEIQMIMVELQNYYNDPSVLSLLYAQKEIEKVKNEMRENIKTIYNNIDDAECMTEKAEKLNENVKKLNHDADLIKEKSQICSFRKCKLFIIIFSFVFVLFLCFLIYLIVLKN